MNKNLLLILSVFFTVFLTSLSHGICQAATIYVDPPSITDLTPGETFTVDINVEDVTDLYGSDFKLSYDTNILDATQIAIGDFLLGGPRIDAVFDWSSGGCLDTGCSYAICDQAVDLNQSVSCSLDISVDDTNPRDFQYQGSGCNEIKSRGDCCGFSIARYRLDENTIRIEVEGWQTGAPGIGGTITFYNVVVTDINVVECVHSGSYSTTEPDWCYLDTSGTYPVLRFKGERLGLSCMSCDCSPINVIVDVNVQSAECTTENNCFSVKQNIFESDGYVWVAATSLNPAEPRSGSGTLATIDFQVTRVGGSTLDLYDTVLGDSNANEISHITVDGDYGAPIPDSCADSDGGDKPKEKGTVSGYQDGEEYSHTDECLSSLNLREYYCVGDNWTSKTYNCWDYYGSNNYCSFGVCKRMGGGGRGGKKSLTDIIDILMQAVKGILGMDEWV